MPADVVSLAAARRARAIASDEPDRQPLALAAQPGAVTLVVGEAELWLAPEQAREIGLDLLELARVAEAAERGPRRG